MNTDHGQSPQAPPSKMAQVPRSKQISWVTTCVFRSNVRQTSHPASAQARPLVNELQGGPSPSAVDASSVFIGVTFAFGAASSKSSPVRDPQLAGKSSSTQNLGRDRDDTMAILRMANRVQSHLDTSIQSFRGKGMTQRGRPRSATKNSAAPSRASRTLAVASTGAREPPDLPANLFDPSSSSRLRVLVESYIHR